MSNKKTYSHKEVTQILSETVKRQKETRKSDEPGLTEEELFQIASESGIDLDALKETLLNFKEKPEKSRWSLFTGSSRIHHVQVIPGEINDETWDEIQVELRNKISGFGTPKKIGVAYELEQVSPDVSYKRLSLIPKKGAIRLEYSEEWSALKILVLILSFTLSSVFTLIFLKELGLAKLMYIMLAPIGGLIGSGLSIFGLQAFYTSKKKKLAQIIGLISKKIKSRVQEKIVIEDDLYLNKDETERRTDSKLKN